MSSPGKTNDGPIWLKVLDVHMLKDLACYGQERCSHDTRALSYKLIYDSCVKTCNQCNFLRLLRLFDYLQFLNISKKRSHCPTWVCRVLHRLTIFLLPSQLICLEMVGPLSSSLTIFSASIQITSYIGSPRLVFNSQRVLVHSSGQKKDAIPYPYTASDAAESNESSLALLLAFLSCSFKTLQDQQHQLLKYTLAV